VRRKVRVKKTRQDKNLEIPFRFYRNGKALEADCVRGAHSRVNPTRSVTW